MCHGLLRRSGPRESPSVPLKLGYDVRADDQTVWAEVMW